MKVSISAPPPNTLPLPPLHFLLSHHAQEKSGFPALWEIQVPPPSLQVQEGEYPNRLDPKNPVYAEETSPSVIVNGFSERLRASHIQRIRPHSEKSGRITCSFSPSPTGLGELSLDQSPCISG